MPSLQEYNKKLASLGNTLKMTKTMKMVSASKLRRAQMLQRNAADYASHVSDIIARLASSMDDGGHPLLTARENPSKALIILFTSDKGLCAGFNNNLIKFTNRWIESHSDQYDTIDMSYCGRRGHSFFNSRIGMDKNYEGVTARPSFNDASSIGNELMHDFLAGTYDHTYLAYNVFQNPLVQTPTISRLLPVDPSALATEGVEPVSLDYEFEPKRAELLEELIPRIVNFKVFYTLLENAAGEHGARMTAMDAATGNAENMIEQNTLLRNRARQAAITTELIEIISGAEAL